MKKHALLINAAVAMAFASTASASTLTNYDKKDAVVEVHVKGSEKTVITLKTNGFFDTNSKPAYFIMGKQKPVMALKGTEHLAIKNGKILHENVTEVPTKIVKAPPADKSTGN